MGVVIYLSRVLLHHTGLDNMIVCPLLYQELHGIPVSARAGRLGKFAVMFVKIFFMLLPLTTDTAPSYLVERTHKLTIVATVPEIETFSSGLININLAKQIVLGSLN